jgi:tetratricopeptide (TPR) repeat protein
MFIPWIKGFDFMMLSTQTRRPVILALLILAGFLFQVSAQARLLDLKPLPPRKVDRLKKDTRKSYEMGMLAIDRINYEQAKDHFTRAIEKEPENVHLRFILVQLAHYLGDTRKGAKSIEYYDLAAINLKNIFESSRLNTREKRKAMEGLEMIRSKRQSVPERDEKRRQHGLEIAKLYAKDIFAGKEEDPDLKKRKAKKRKSEDRRTETGQEDK